MTNEEIQEYLENMEKIIKEHGHFIQGVNDYDGVIKYAYTIGRTDGGKREIYMDVIHVDYLQVINYVCRKLDAGEIELHKPFNVPGYKFGNHGMETIFGLTDKYPPNEDKVIGIYTRAYRLGTDIKSPLTIVMGDALNRLPEYFSSDL